MDKLETLPGVTFEIPAVKRGASLLSEQPQGRLETFGPSALSDGELLALVMQSASRGPVGEAKDKALAVLGNAGSLAAVVAWSAADWRREAGVSDLLAAKLAAMGEIGRRAVRASHEEKPVLNRPDVIAAYMSPMIGGLEVEQFWVLCLNRKNRLLRAVCITSGTATAALAHPREVFRAAIRESAAAVVCVHNHPSGDPGPSAPDLQVTRQIREAAKAVDIDLLDHVIVGRSSADPLGRGFFSFREAGLL